MAIIVKFFDKLEDKVRARLSRHPIVYAFIGGIGIVLFWRGVWGFADQLEILNGLWGMILTIAISTLLLMITGIFVSFFITDRIILSGLKQEKKLVEKTEEEVKAEENVLIILSSRMDKIEKELKDLKEIIKSSLS